MTRKDTIIAEQAREIKRLKERVKEQSSDIGRALVSERNADRLALSLGAQLESCKVTGYRLMWQHMFGSLETAKFFTKESAEHYMRTLKAEHEMAGHSNTKYWLKEDLVRDVPLMY